MLFPTFKDIKDQVSSFPENQKIGKQPDTSLEAKNTRAKIKNFKVNVDTAENSY